MSREKYDIVWAANEASKENYNIGVFVLNAFYRVSNLSSLKQSYDEYALSRFSQTIEDYQEEHSKLKHEQLSSFYEDLKYNKQNLAYLYSLFEKSRTSTYRLHMKILARLSLNLVENKTLNYYESSLLANIHLLNENDFVSFYKVIKFNKNEPALCKWSEKNIKYSHEDIISLNKFLSIGIISANSALVPGDNSPVSNISFYRNGYTEKLFNILDEFNCESQ